MRKNARIVIAAFGVVFAAFVGVQLRRHAPAANSAGIAHTDPGALIETTGGQTLRFTLSREDVHVTYDKLLTYASGASKLVGVTITTDSRDRTFVVTGREGAVGQNESTIALDGDVRLKGSDGMVAKTEHATYTQGDGSVAAPGPVEFSKGRMSGQGTGLKYDKARDVLWILDRAAVRIAPTGDDPKGGGVDLTAGTAAFARADKFLQFDHGVHIVQSGQTIDAESAIARLSDDSQRIESLELHNRPRIAGTTGGPGSLRGLTGADMTLNYAPDGQALQRALIVGDAAIQLAGETDATGRRISAQTLNITMAPDGITPIGLTGRDAVQLMFPAEGTTPGRTIQATQIDAKGDAGQGLTRATFIGAVSFRERGPDIDRAAKSAQLEVGMKPGMTTIDEARFLHAVHFEEGRLAAIAASAKYDTAKGTLELTGSEPGTTTPRAVTDRIAVDATRIDIVLEGPQVKAAGTVKSTLQPANSANSTNPTNPTNPAGSSDVKLPSMLKQDQPVTVLADTLSYDGGASTALYTGNARLFQVDTTIKGDTITVDEKRGDLAASGHAIMTTIREQENKDKKKERVQSTGTSTDLKYEDAPRRLTYTGSAHLVGPEGDMSASKIELYLKPGGDDVERAEGYAGPDDKLTLREPTRTTTGSRLTYTSDKETYVVTGLPATVIDQCGRENTGKTLTLVKSTDTIVADGNQQIRTQSKGGTGQCK
ncbi:MAG TPA: LptA/OstA family protein [Vicinamibacterales bacterium]|nr:LptA/OstA family protein [Vicinamibacterales bacterium]